MGKVGTGFSMSLDGFITGLNGDMSELFRWYALGDTEFRFPGGRWAIKVSEASARLIGQQVSSTGALVVGRRHFDEAKGWDGQHPMNVPVFVVSHRPPPDWLEPNSPFSFVSEGVEAAIARAKAVAGDKDIGVGGANVAQQAINAGLIDEIGVDLVPVLLGTGVRFFDHLEPRAVKLEQTMTVEGIVVTHLRYRVVKL